MTVKEASYRFEALDAFRGIAAIMVALFHFSVNGYLSKTNLLNNSWLFVDFFFVLSGFVISYGYINKIKNLDNLLFFIKKRFIRIYPLHLFMLILFVPFAIINIFMGIDLGNRFSFTYFLENLFLIQALGFASEETWNIPAWSISAEFYTYILFALLLITTSNKIRENIFIYLIISLISLLVLFNFSSMKDTFHLALFRCTYSFFLGIIALLIYKKFNIKWYFEWIILALILVFLSLHQIKSTSIYAFSSPILFFLAIIIFSHEKGHISKILKNNIFQILGKLSFSIYLTHAWFITVIKSLSVVCEKLFNFKYMYEFNGERFIDFGIGYLNDLIFIPYLAIVLFFSWLTYNYIEMYFQKLLLLKINKKGKKPINV